MIFFNVPKLSGCSTVLGACHDVYHGSRKFFAVNPEVGELIRRLSGVRF